MSALSEACSAASAASAASVTARAHIEESAFLTLGGGSLASLALSHRMSRGGDSTRGERLRDSTGARDRYLAEALLPRCPEEQHPTSSGSTFASVVEGGPQTSTSARRVYLGEPTGSAPSMS